MHTLDLFEFGDNAPIAERVINRTYDEAANEALRQEVDTHFTVRVPLEEFDNQHEISYFQLERALQERFSSSHIAFSALIDGYINVYKKYDPSPH